MSIETITAAMARLTEAREAEADAVQQTRDAIMAARKAVGDHHEAKWWEGKVRLRCGHPGVDDDGTLVRVDGEWATVAWPRPGRIVLPGGSLAEMQEDGTWDIAAAGVAGAEGAVPIRTAEALVHVETGIRRTDRRDGARPCVNVDDLHAAVAAWRGRDG